MIKTLNVDEKCENFFYIHILILEQVVWDENPDLCIDTILKKLNFEFDPDIDKTRLLNLK